MAQVQKQPAMYYSAYASGALEPLQVELDCLLESEPEKKLNQFFQKTKN